MISACISETVRFIRVVERAATHGLGGAKTIHSRESVSKSGRTNFCKPNQARLWDAYVYTDDEAIDEIY